MNDSGLDQIAAALRQAGFSRYNYGNRVKYVMEKPFRRGVPPVFHIVAQPGIEIFSRPHLGALIPFAALMCVAIYQILIVPAVRMNESLNMSGLFFLVLCVSVVNIANYVVFRKDLEQFQLALRDFLCEAT